MKNWNIVILSFRITWCEWWASDEQSKSFHQDLMIIEKHYQGYLDENMVSDYYWILICETDLKVYKKQKLNA